AGARRSRSSADRGVRRAMTSPVSSAGSIGVAGATAPTRAIATATTVAIALRRPQDTPAAVRPAPVVLVRPIPPPLSRRVVVPPRSAGSLEGGHPGRQ